MTDDGMSIKFVSMVDGKHGRSDFIYLDMTPL